jgi:tRNA A37 threonylcarbamoyladenosine synthetase subunit TsaC/SUA5/YrdC
MMSVTLIMPGDEYPLTDPYDIRQIMEPHIDVFIDGGYCGLEPSTVVDMTGAAPEIIRQGMGDFSVYL